MSNLTAPCHRGIALPPGRESITGPDGGVSGSDFLRLSLHLCCDPAQSSRDGRNQQNCSIPELAKLQPEFPGQVI